VFQRRQIRPRAGKGDKDRHALLPAALARELAAHLEAWRVARMDDLARGAGWVEMPTALVREYPGAGRA
jgi:hypothetical protein